MRGVWIRWRAENRTASPFNREPGGPCVGGEMLACDNGVIIVLLLTLRCSVAEEKHLGGLRCLRGTIKAEFRGKLEVYVSALSW